MSLKSYIPRLEICILFILLFITAIWFYVPIDELDIAEKKLEQLTTETVQQSKAKQNTTDLTTIDSHTEDTSTTVAKLSDNSALKKQLNKHFGQLSEEKILTLKENNQVLLGEEDIRLIRQILRHTPNQKRGPRTFYYHGSNERELVSITPVERNGNKLGLVAISWSLTENLTPNEPPSPLSSALNGSKENIQIIQRNKDDQTIALQRTPSTFSTNVATIIQSGDKNIADGQNETQGQHTYLWGGPVDHTPNSIGIHQEGTANIASLYQTSSATSTTTSNTAGIHQSGDRLTARTVQNARAGDTGNIAFIKQVQTVGGVGSLATVNQIGANNEFWVYQDGDADVAHIDQYSAGEDNIAEILQTGNDNISTIDIIQGDHNYLFIDSAQGDNLAQIAIRQNTNDTYIRQSDESNEVNVFSRGDLAFIDIDQTNYGNISNVDITGDYDTIIIKQSASRNNADAIIYGSNNKGIIFQQGGTGNTATISVSNAGDTSHNNYANIQQNNNDNSAGIIQQ